MRYERAAILCGGRSKRMGTDKALLRDSSGGYLLETMIDALAERFDEIAIVRRDNKPLPFSRPKLILLTDPPDSDGPLCGVYTALSGAKGYVFIIACDMPNISLELIDAMYEALESDPKPICLCEANSFLQPMYAFYHANLLNDMKEYIGRMSPTRYIAKQDYIVIAEPFVKKFNPSLNAFDNINNPDALKAYQSTAN